MAFLSLVLPRRFPVAESNPLAGRAIQQQVQALRGEDDALHALLSLVPQEGPKTLARQAFPGNLHKMRLLGRY
mgnify:CR=1 FL=1